MHPTTTRIRPLPALALSVLVAAGCGAGAASIAPSATSGGQPTDTASTAPTPSATPFARPTLPPPPLTPIPDAGASDVTLKLTAHLAEWSATTLTAPAGKTWTIDLTNSDESSHNFTIEFGTSDFPVIYKAELPPGKVSAVVPAFPAGTYTFICTIHPTTMVGALTLK